MTTFSIRMAIHAMHRGGVIAYPTEAVFGLGCNPLNGTAVHRLLELKQRPIHKGLIIIAAELSQLQPYIIEPEPDQLQTLEQSWPGASTWLVPARPEVPYWLRGKHATIAVRVTAHPVAASLCREFGGAIVSTSANPASHPAARDALSVHHYFNGQLEYVLHGKVDKNKKPTEIRNLTDGKIIRSA